MSKPRDDALQKRRRFMILPLMKRRKIMRQQAEELQQHYEETFYERHDIQDGDIVDLTDEDLDEDTRLA